MALLLAIDPMGGFEALPHPNQIDRNEFGALTRAEKTPAQARYAIRS
jgi:hypothetical protein